MPIKKILKFNGKKVEAWVPDPKRKKIAGKELEKLLKDVVAKKAIEAEIA